MPSSADQARWFNHHPSITGSDTPFSSTVTPHHPVVTPYMDHPYMDDMLLQSSYNDPSAYYGINNPYAAAHQRRLSGKLIWKKLLLKRELV